METLTSVASHQDRPAAFAHRLAALESCRRRRCGQLCHFVAGSPDDPRPELNPPHWPISSALKLSRHLGPAWSGLASWGEINQVDKASERARLATAAKRRSSWPAKCGQIFNSPHLLSGRPTPNRPTPSVTCISSSIHLSPSFTLLLGTNQTSLAGGPLIHMAGLASTPTTCCRLISIKTITTTESHFYDQTKRY